MSYENTDDNYQYSSGAQYKYKANNDEYYGLNEPLLDQGFHQASKEIRVQLEQLQGNMIQLGNNIKKYEDSLNQHRSTSMNYEVFDQQDQRVRQQVNEMVTKMTDSIFQIKEKVHNFRDIPVDTVNENQQRMQEYNTYQEQLNEIAKKFENLVKKFTNLEEKSLEQARISLVQRKKSEENDEEKGGISTGPSQSQNQEPVQKQKQAQNVSIREQAEVDQMEDLINHRKQQLQKVEKLMLDVHWVAKDIHVELQNQNEKLKKIDQNIFTTMDNVDRGMNQLTQAKQRNKRKNKCLTTMLICVSVTVLLLVISIIMEFTM